MRSVPCSLVVRTVVVHLMLVAGVPAVLAISLFPHAASGQDPVAPSTVCTPSGRWDAVHLFIGIASPDTILAGHGPVGTELPTSGFMGTEMPASIERGDPIFGQLVHIEAWGELSPGRGDPRLADSVVVVPWASSPEGDQYPWYESARWVQPASRRLFVARLRKPEHWANGIPTLDALGGPYPDLGPSQQQYVREQGWGILTVDEYLQLCSVPMDRDELRRSGWKALGPAMTWARANRGVSGKYSARVRLVSLAWRAERTRVKALEPDVAGTYRAHVELPSGERLQFWFRTASVSDRILSRAEDGTLTGRIPFDQTRPPWDTRAEGYEIDLWLADEESALPARDPDRTGQRCERLPGAYGNRALRTDSGVVVRSRVSETRSPPCLSSDWPWKVEILDEGRAEDRTAMWEMEILRYYFSENEELEAFLEDYYSRPRAVGRPHAPGRISRGPAGELRYEQTMELEPGSAVRMTAERVSSVSVSSPEG